MTKVNGLGQVNVNLDHELRAVDRKRCEERYHRDVRKNLGWTMRIERVNPDAEKDFEKIRGKKVDTLYPIPQSLSPGLYLDCTIHYEDGHKKHRHTLYRLTKEGSFEHVMNAAGGKKWRESLLPSIEKELQTFPLTYSEKDAIDHIIAQARDLNPRQLEELKGRLNDQ